MGILLPRSTAPTSSTTWPTSARAAGNPAMIVMCDEQISYVRRILAGIGLDRELLAVETIRATGPGGNYLTADTRLQHFRQQVWQPTLVNRDNPDTWRRRGACATRTA